MIRLLSVLLLAATPALAVGQDAPLRWPEGCLSSELRAAGHRLITEDAQAPTPFREALHRCVQPGGASKPLLRRT